MSSLRVILLSTPLLFAAAPLRADDWETAAARATEAVVDVLVADRHHGTGFLVDPSGLAITAAHAVAVGDRRIELLLPDGTRSRATVVARDLGHDLALLRAESREEEFSHLPIAKAAPRLGEEIAVYGTPLHRRGLLLFGRVARDEPGFEYLGDRQHYVECRYVSGLAPKGTSGGPWLNTRGEVVGMQIGGISLPTGWQGISFVAPTAAIRTLVESESEQPTPTIRVAVEETWQQPAEFLEKLLPGTTGLVVKVLDENGPAAKAGVKRGDIVVTADDTAVQFVADLVRIVRRKSAGEEIALEILGRNGDPNYIVKVSVRVLVEGGGPPAS